MSAPRSANRRGYREIPRRQWTARPTALAERMAPLSDAVVAAHAIAWDLAALQPEPGIFRNRQVLGGYLERRGRTISGMLEAGLLIEHQDGRMELEGWRSLNSDPTAAKRAKAYRERQPVTQVAVTDPSEDGSSVTQTAVTDSEPPRDTVTPYKEQPTEQVTTPEGDKASHPSHDDSPTPRAPTPRPLRLTEEQGAFLDAWEAEHSEAGDSTWRTRMQEPGGDVYGRAKQDHRAWEAKGRPAARRPRPTVIQDPDEAAEIERRNQEGLRRTRALLLARGTRPVTKEGDEELLTWGRALLALEAESGHRPTTNEPW